MSGTGSTLVAVGMGGAGWGLGYGRYRPPFTSVQWQELEHQAMIYKYLVAGLPVPPDLVIPIRHSFEAKIDSTENYRLLLILNVYPVECHTPHPLNNMAADASSEIKISIENEEEKKMIELIERGQWLRATILGANDGLLSTTSLMLGVGAAKEDKWLMIISGLAGAVAGACSMAVGEFVSVSTQRDIELQANILKSSSPMAETRPALANLHVASSMASTSCGIPM